MTVGERIKQARKARDNMSRTDLAKLSGVPYPTLAGIENGDQKSSTDLDAIAKALRVRLGYLKNGEKPMDLPMTEDSDEFEQIRASKQPASMGGGADGDEYAEAHKLKFRRESLLRKHLRPDHLKVYYGRGDSMEPTIPDGAAIMYDTSRHDPEDDTIFVIWHENRLYVKRLGVLDDGTILIQSDNPVGKWRKKIRVRPGDDFIIEGKVVWLANWVQC